ncbi:hypothetical protein FPV67DRAFT_1449899 [Lyophyllum atratum]|nr:hypothetical protein FPV67DRAFT_1449899 [Lyophyllum atratum]
MQSIVEVPASLRERRDMGSEDQRRVDEVWIAENWERDSHGVGMGSVVRLRKEAGRDTSFERHWSGRVDAVKEWERRWVRYNVALDEDDGTRTITLLVPTRLAPGSRIKQTEPVMEEQAVFSRKREWRQRKGWKGWAATQPLPSMRSGGQVVELGHHTPGVYSSAGWRLIRVNGDEPPGRLSDDLLLLRIRKPENGVELTR